MHECTSWRALGCMNFGTDPRSIGFDFAAGAFAPPIGFTAGGGGGGHQGFGRTGGFGGGAGGVRFACFADGRGGYFGSGGLDDLEGCEGSGCRRSFGFSTPWIGLKGKQGNANTTYAWKKQKGFMHANSNLFFACTLRIRSFSGILDTRSWGYACRNAGMHAWMGNGCMCYACVWSWLGARAARDDSTWLMSLSCTRQEQKIVKTSCVNDMRVWMRMHGFGFIKKIYPPASLL